MKRLLSLAILLYALPTFSQGGSGKSTLVQSSPEPLPACTPATVGKQEPIIWDLTTGQLMACGPSANQWSQANSGGGGGGVSSFNAAGTLGPFATFAVTTATTTPLLTFT